MSCKIQKIALACLYLTFCLCASLSAKAQVASSNIIASFKSSDKIFSIVREGEDPNFSYVVKLNNRNVTVINNRFVDVEGYYRLSELGDVVILSSANGGNGCPKMLIIVAFDEEKLLSATPEFGNCHEEPTFIVSSSNVKINFLYGNVPISETWIYDKNGLRQIKKSLTKKRK